MEKREVTVLVLCFNSGKTVIETLESIRKQTYPYIHLIVSDDCSQDDTYDKVGEWKKSHGSHFLSCKLLRTRHNLGVSLHMNACVENVKTEWFKGLAADDILLPDCIEKYVKFLDTHNCRGMIYAKHLSFHNSGSVSHYWIDYEEIRYQKKFAELTAEKQRISIAKREFLCSPTCFTNRNDVLKAGGYDLRIRNIEDWPIKMRLIDFGCKMAFMDEYTVLYRVGDSISRSNDIYFKPDFIKLERKVKELYCYPIANRSLIYRWNNAVTNLRYWIIINLCGNKRNRVTQTINIFLGLLNFEKVKKAVINTIYKRKSENMVQEVLKMYEINDSQS